MIQKENTILLTGGTGFLGSHVLDVLLEKGFSKIIVLSRQDLRTEHEYVEYVQCDIRDVFQLDDFLNKRKIDCIVHTAGIVSFQKTNRKEMFAVNVDGTANLINLALDHSISKFIHVSSTAAIGKNLDDTEINEQTKWSNKLAHTQYALSKFLSEKHVWRGGAEGLQVSIVNPALILGVGDWRTGTPGFFKTISSGLKYYPTGSNGIVAAKDVGRFITHLILDGEYGERYILSSENISYKSLFERIAQALDVQAPFIPIEGRYKLLAVLKEFFSRLGGGGSNYLSKESLENISEDKLYSNLKSTSRFNFSYQSVSEMVEDISNTFKSDHR